MNFRRIFADRVSPIRSRTAKKRRWNAHTETLIIHVNRPFRNARSRRWASSLWDYPIQVLIKFAMILLLFTPSSSSRKFISSTSRSRSRKRRTTPETKLFIARHRIALVGAFTTTMWTISCVLYVELIIVLPVRWALLIFKTTYWKTRR